MSEYKHPTIRITRETINTDLETLAENAREVALSYLESWRSRFEDPATATEAHDYASLPGVAEEPETYVLVSASSENFVLIQSHAERGSTTYVFEDGQLIITHPDTEPERIDDLVRQQSWWDEIGAILYACDASERDNRLVW